MQNEREVCWASLLDRRGQVKGMSSGGATELLWNCSNKGWASVLVSST